MMRLRLLALTVFASLALLMLPQAGTRLNVSGATARAAEVRDQDKDKEKTRRGEGSDAEDGYNERDEFTRSFTLAAGSPVRISGINGAIEVETSASGAAEVRVLRTARNRSDLDYRKVIVEQTAQGGLVVRGENEREHEHDWDGDRHQVRQRVWLRVPRNIEFWASGVNGRANVGEIDGPVHLSGVNGAVNVAQARGYTEINGVNGSVTMTIAQLGERGARVSGINGRVELRFDGALNANLSVHGVNGSVNADMPNVTVQGRVSRTSFDAVIGSGGAPINVSGVNGSVRLVPRS